MLYSINIYKAFILKCKSIINLSLDLRNLRIVNVFPVISKENQGNDAYLI